MIKDILLRMRLHLVYSTLRPSSRLHFLGTLSYPGGLELKARMEGRVIAKGGGVTVYHISRRS